jgi:hypothetical protein
MLINSKDVEQFDNSFLFNKMLMFEKNGNLYRYAIKKETSTFGIDRGMSRLCWYKRIDKSKENKPSGREIHITPINPFPGWLFLIKYNFEMFYLKITKTEYKQCQGCGMGIAEFRIRNPNHGYGNERYNCCKECVDFYDRRWSAMDIVGWKDDKPICKKGSRCIEVEGVRKENERKILDPI